jgi:hypothetical protein
MFWFYHTGSIWQQEWWWESGTVRKGSILLTVWPHKFHVKYFSRLSPSPRHAISSIVSPH